MVRSAAALALLPALAALASPALSAEGAPTPGALSAEALMLAQVMLLVIGGRMLGELMYRIGQPTIIGQILAGILLGPTVLGSLWPAAEQALFPSAPEQQALIGGLSQLGILFLFLLAGMETDLGLAWRLRARALGVSLAGSAVPFVFGIALGLLLPETVLPQGGRRLVTALFIGTALSISSLKIVATVVREMDFMRRNVGQLIVASAVIDDTAGWVIIAITLGIATTGSVMMGPLAITVVGTALFLALAFTVGRRAAFDVIRWTNDNLHSDLPVTTAIIGIMGLLALLTALIGVQTVLGAFVAGLLIGQSPILTRQIDEQLRGLTTALFMPVFFGLTGLHADLRVLLDPATALLALGLVVIASLGKFGGAFLGAWLSGMSRAEALALGFGMNARGSTEVIVASIGLSVGVLDQRLFSVIVTMAIVTTLIMPPTLRWALARLPLSEEEKQRLDRAQYEQESFVSDLERILVLTDRSGSGELAEILAGHVGGLRNMPVTVLQAARRPALDPEPDQAAARVKASSEESIARAREADGMRDSTIHVEARAADAADLDRAIRAESDKGHDLMFVGLDVETTQADPYGAPVRSALDAFGGSAAIISARGALRRDPDAPLRLLVPVSGDNRSMRSVEMASIIAGAAKGSVSAIYVPPDDETASRTAAQVETIFARVQEIGRHYDINIRTAIGRAGQRELSILTRARAGRYNLIVLGVGRRAGDIVSFGSLADNLLQMSDRALMFFVTS